VTDSVGLNTLYRNNADGTFSLSRNSSRSQVPILQHSQGAVFADFNNDGWKDLYVVTGAKHYLFHNNGGQGFIDISAPAGIDNDNNSKTASWGDLTTTAGSTCTLPTGRATPNADRSMDGETDRLYRNNGDGTFTNVTDYLKGGTLGAGFVASFHRFRQRRRPGYLPRQRSFVNPDWQPPVAQRRPRLQRLVLHPNRRRSRRKLKKSLAWGWQLAITTTTAFDYYFSNVGPMDLAQQSGQQHLCRSRCRKCGTQAPEGITGAQSSSITTTTAGATCTSP
jgi:hypothetical protein